MLSAVWQLCSTSENLQRSSHNIKVAGGNIYVFGGELVTRQPGDNEIFEILPRGRQRTDVQKRRLSLRSSSLASSESNTKIVTTNGPIPSPRVGSASAVLNNKIYFFSGRDGENMMPIEELGSLWVFDPSTSSWSLLTPANPSDAFPSRRSYHCVTSDGSELIFVHSGRQTEEYLSDLWSFNVTKKIWSNHADAPAPPRGGSSIAYSKGQIYRMNGFDGKKEQGGQLDVFNLESNTWDFKPFRADGDAGPAPRCVSTLLPVSIDGKSMLVTLFGASGLSDVDHVGAGKVFDDIWAYDIDQAKWHKVDAKRDYDRGPPARGWFDADILDISTVVISGGLAKNNERLSDCWLLKL